MRKKTARKKIYVTAAIAAAAALSCGTVLYTNGTGRQAAEKSGMDFSSKKIFLQLKDSQEIKDKKDIEASYRNMYLLSFSSEKETEDMYHYYKDKADYIDTDAGMSIAGKAEGENKAASFEKNPIASLSEEMKKAEPVKEKTIALIDTGVSETKPADARYTVIGGSVYDENGHGDQMVDAMKSQNPDAHIVSIKALDKNGNGTSASICAAVKLAESIDADIINLSLSSEDAVGTAVVKGVLEEAAQNGRTIVGAAGNDGTQSVYTTPGNVDHALIVGTCADDGERLSNSNYGKLVDYNIASGSTSEAAAKMSGYLSKHTAVIPDNTVIFQPDLQPDADGAAEIAEANTEDAVSGSSSESGAGYGSEAGSYAAFPDDSNDDLYDGNMLNLDTESLKEGQNEKVEGTAKKEEGDAGNAEKEEEDDGTYLFTLPDKIGGMDTTILNSASGSNRLTLKETDGTPSREASVTVEKIDQSSPQTSSVTLKVSAPTEDGKQAEGTFTFKTKMDGNRTASYDAAEKTADSGNEAAENADDVHPDFSTMRLIIDTDASNIRPEDPVIGSYGTLSLLQFDSEEKAKEAWNYYRSKDIPVQADTVVTSLSTEKQTAKSDTEKLGTGKTKKEKNTSKEAGKMTKENNPFTALSKAAAKAELSSGSIAMIDAGSPENAAVVDRVILIGTNKGKDSQAQAKLDRILAENKDAKVVSIKALDDDGNGYVSSILAGAIYAREVNASYAGMSIASDTRGDDAVSSRVLAATADSGVLLLSTPNDLGADAGDEITADTPDDKASADADVTIKADSAPEAVARLTGILSKEGAVQPVSVSDEVEVNTSRHLLLEDGKPVDDSWSVQDNILTINGKPCGNPETDENGEILKNRWMAEEDHKLVEYTYSPEEDALERRVLPTAG